MNLGIAHRIRLQRFLNWQNHGNECNHLCNNNYINPIFCTTFFNRNLGKEDLPIENKLFSHNKS